MTPGQSRILPKILFVLFTALYIWQLTHIQTHYNRQDKVINEDALGYYIILPALFKYQDPDFEFIDTVLRKTKTYETYIPPVINPLNQNQQVCKYYSGVAIMQAPFFLLAQLTDRDNDNGFGPHYQFWILISVVVYVLIGSYLYFRLFMIYGASPLLAFVMLVYVVFGTNLQAYISYDPAYSHAYTYCVLAVFLSSLHHLAQKRSMQLALLTGLSLGLIAVIRPLNLYLGLLIPAYLGIHFLIKFKQNFSQISLLFLGFIVFPLIQSLLWYWQTGQFLVYPYGNEKLQLSKPELFEFLFGFDNGWAVYTPSAFVLLLLGIALSCFNRSYKLAVFSLLGFGGILYLLSTWYYLHYGCTAGCRPITEYYGLMALLFIKTWHENPYKRTLKWVVAPILLSCFVYNRIVLYQYFNHIINWCNMDKARFSMIFMRTHEVYKYSTYPFWDFSAYDAAPIEGITIVNKTLKTDESVNIETDRITDTREPVLVDIRGKARTTNRTAYLRILITRDGQYIEQQTLLLQRKMKTDGQWHDYEFQFPLNTTMQGLNFWIKPETVDGGKDGEVYIKEICFKTIL